MSNERDNSWGNLLETSIPLDAFGAPGFSLQERVDFSGHRSGRVTPHVNAELVNNSGNVLSRDLANAQLPGFNSMQASNE